MVAFAGFTRLCVPTTAWLHPGTANSRAAYSWPQLRDRCVLPTYRGRTAIRLACRLLGIEPEDEILFPAYSCGSELDPLIHAGLRVVGYRVSRTCEIDWADLHSKYTSRTRAVYVTHYFGWEHPLALLRQWCDERGLLLIEDCALALFSDGPSGMIGRAGDAAIFSLAKTFGTGHGALLSLARPVVAEPVLAEAGRGVLAREFERSAKADLARVLAWARVLGPVRSILRRDRQTTSAPDETALAPLSDSQRFDPRVHLNRSPHPRLLQLCASVSPVEVQRRRRENYLALEQSLSDVAGIKPLFPQLPPGVTPLAYPAVTERRDELVERLLKSGVDAHPWWAGFHPTGLRWGEFPDACWLKRHVLTLPVHQYLARPDIARMAATIRRVVAQGDLRSSSL